MLSLAPEMLSFEKMYGDLIEKLKIFARRQRVSEPDDAIDYLSKNTPKAILVTDSGLTEHSVVLNKVLSYVRGGGTGIFCCQFSIFISPKDFNLFFSEKLKLDWEFGYLAD